MSDKETREKQRLGKLLRGKKISEQQYVAGLVKFIKPYVAPKSQKTVSFQGKKFPLYEKS